LVVKVTGEAQYINDIAPAPGELQAAFVVSTVGNAKIASIDVSQAEVGRAGFCMCTVSILHSVNISIFKNKLLFDLDKCNLSTDASVESAS